MSDKVEQVKRYLMKLGVPSSTGQEGVMVELLEEMLRGLGFRTIRQEVEPGRCNLLAVRGGAPKLLISTHLDTVPAWGADYRPRFVEEWVYMRGAVDTKGQIASLLLALEETSDPLASFSSSTNRAMATPCMMSNTF